MPSGADDFALMHARSIGRLYHLVEKGNLASIQCNGLLSTSQLLDRAGLRGDDRERLERQQRRSRTVLPNGVILRDQSPMPPEALARCLIDGTTPPEWYMLVNTMVFFWVDLERLIRQARACQPWPQVILELDAQRLLSARAEQAFVTPINSGNARRRPAPRGRASFVPFDSWTRSGWLHESAALGVATRPASHRPVEVVIPHAVPEIMDYVVELRRFDNNGAMS